MSSGHSTGLEVKWKLNSDKRISQRLAGTDPGLFYRSSFPITRLTRTSPESHNLENESLSITFLSGPETVDLRLAACETRLPSP